MKRRLKPTSAEVDRSEARRRIDQIEMRGIVKRFPGVLANDHVDLEIRAGEVLALLGENGAGKTTLMRILYGLYRPNAGTLLINHKAATFKSPSDAVAAGIGMIHQHFMLVSDMTVVENVVLGLPFANPFHLDLRNASRRVQELATRYGLRVEPNNYIWQLASGERQRVEILKALYRQADVLILDEPTSVLTPQEVDDLFITLRQMAANGHAIVFISHKLREVLAIANRIAVLRNGRVVQTLMPQDTSAEHLARLMVGREVRLDADCQVVEKGPERLVLCGISAPGDTRRSRLQDVTLSICSGEIVGLAGVSGNGQRELLEVIAGVRPSTKGSILIDGVDVTGWSPSQLVNIGLSVTPEERLTEATIPELTVSENLVLKDHSDPSYARAIFLRRGRIAKHSAALCQQFDVRASSVAAPLKTLSGGNIQKLILARELSRQPKVLVAANPTRGMDVGATEYIRNLVRERRCQGTATLLISEDLDEIINLSDRIAVMYEGEIVGIFDRAEATMEKIGLLMTGSKKRD